MQTIYVTEPDVIDLEHVKKALPEGEYRILRGDTDFSGDIPEDCTALLIRSATTVTSDIKKRFPRLKSIIRIGTGLDAVDLAYCKEQQINVYNSPGANADAVSDYVVCMMLYALRKLHALHADDVKVWDRFKFIGRNISKQSIGIVGFGNIGRQVHAKLTGFGCEIFYVYDPFVKQADVPAGVTVTSLENVLKDCDIVTLHLPLMAETRYMIDEKALGLMKENAILLNASRGGIVDESAVLKVLAGKNLTYIADTVENEPHVNTQLLSLPNVIVTPHIASLTDSSEEAMVTAALDNFMQGRRAA